MSVNGNGNSAEYPNNSDTMTKLIALENRTGYRMQQFNGQRKFWNPKWDEAIPPRGCEVFVGKIPRDLYEDELVPVFEKIGQIYELRLMMDFSGYNRGYAFVCYTCREHAKQAIEKLDNYEIRPGLRIGVCKSVDNCRLFVNGLPKDKSQQEIRKAMSEVSDDVSDVIVHPGNGPGEKNRGFAFVEYQTHRAAAMARRKLMPGRITIFGSEVVTDWAEPEIDMNDTLSRIKNVYVRNLKLTTTEYAIYYAFNNIRPGAIERVKKIQDRDYAFVHFLKREDALYAVQVMNGQKIDGQEIQVSLAKPPTNKNDTLNSILQTFSIQQKPAATQRPSYPSVGNKTTVQDRLSSFLLRNPSPNPLNPLNNYSMLSTPELQANANRAQQAAFLSGLQLPPPPLPTNFAHHQQQQLNTQKQGGNINGVAPSSGMVHSSNYPQLPNLNNASQNSFTSALPYSSGVQDCACNGLNTGSGIQSNQLANGISNNNEELTPVSTLDHIAKIQCPIVYLDEISAMFSGGSRPIYNLFSENCLGKTQYVYRVTFMGTSYMPPARLYCEDVSEAKNIAAKYVIKEADNWIKKQMTAMVNGSQSMMLRSNYAPSRASPALGDASNANINSKQNSSNNTNNNSIFNTNSPLWSTPASSTLLTSFDDRAVEQQLPNNVGGAGDVSNYFPPPNSKATTNNETIFANTTNASDLDSLWEEIRKNQVRTTQASQNFTATMDRGQQANNFNSLYNASLFKQGNDRINQTAAAGGYQLQQAAAAQQTQQGGNRSSPSVFDLVGNEFHSLSIDD